MDIPLFKLEQPGLKYFIEKWTEHTSPSSTAMRQKPMGQIYTEALEKAREYISKDSIYISVDGTTDAETSQLLLLEA